MPSAAIGVSGRGSVAINDTTPGGPGFIGIYISEFNPVLLDASFRYNPEWRTFGHFSLILQSTVLYEHWVNFRYQVFRTITMPNQASLTELGFSDFQDPVTGQFNVPYEFAYQFREGVVADIFYLT